MLRFLLLCLLVCRVVLIVTIVVAINIEVLHSANIFSCWAGRIGLLDIHGVCRLFLSNSYIGSEICNWQNAIQFGMLPDVFRCVRARDSSLLAVIWPAGLWLQFFVLICWGIDLFLVHRFLNLFLAFLYRINHFLSL